MSVESAEDRAVFVNPDEFGIAALFEGGTTVNGILDTGWFAADVGAGAVIEGSRLRFVCRSADLPVDFAHGNAITIDGTDYLVGEIHHDGTGMTEFVLEAQ